MPGSVSIWHPYFGSSRWHFIPSFVLLDHCVCGCPQLQQIRRFHPQWCTQFVWWTYLFSFWNVSTVAQIRADPLSQNSTHGWPHVWPKWHDISSMTVAHAHPLPRPLCPALASIAVQTKMCNLWCLYRAQVHQKCQKCSTVSAGLREPVHVCGICRAVFSSRDSGG